MKKITSRRYMTLLLLVLIGVALLGFTAHASIDTLIAQGTIPFVERFDGPADTYIFKSVLAPGEIYPWHYHTGPATVIITRGVLVEESGCGELHEYPAGTAFTEDPGVVHQVRNQSETEEAEIYFTLIVPSGAQTDIFVDGPVCGSPRDEEQCKNSGWMRFNHPRFKNQGDCISFAEHQKRRRSK
jgi:quercetin dioxygenase-like cupin family protein